MTIPTAHKPRIRLTADGLANFVSGLGTERDKRFHNRFVYTASFWDLAELEAAYTTSWLARQVVDAPVEDATREWRTFSCDEATDIQAEEKRLRLQQVVQDGFRWGRLYGGAGILMVTDQPLDKPLDVKRIKKGGLKKLIEIDRRYLNGHAQNFTDPLADNFGLPEYYTIAGGSQQIHHSHVVRIPGAKLPRILRDLNSGWDDSVLRQCLEDLKDAVSAKGGIASLIQEANVDVIQRQGLSDELATDFGTEQVTKRYQLAALLKSINRMLLLDGNEEYTRNPATFGGLGEVLRTLMEWVSGAAQIPMTRLFGVQAKGLGDSGEGDMRNYFNAIRSQQESAYRDVLERIDQVLIRSAVGYLPDEYEFEWNPLSQPSDVELAQQQLAFAQADDIRLQQGAVRVSQVMRKLQSGGVYAISDADIEAQEKLEREEAAGIFDPAGDPDADEFGAAGEEEAAGEADPAE